MKRLIYVFILVCLSACTFFNGEQSSSPTPSPTYKEITTATLAQNSEHFNPSTSYNFKIIEFSPDDWEKIYDSASVWKLQIDSKDRIWGLLGFETIGFYDGDQWIFYSSSDFGIEDYPSDLVVAQDDSVWMVTDNSLIHYKNGKSVLYPMVSPDNYSVPMLLCDPTGLIWVVFRDCSCGNLVKTFDGKKWNTLRIEPNSTGPSPKQIIMTDKGSIWAAYTWPYGISEVGDGVYKHIAGNEIWLNGNKNTAIRIASDRSGNIYAINQYESTIVNIGTDGAISRIGIDLSSTEFDVNRLRIFVDSEERIWINTQLKEDETDCLFYYEDGRWFAYFHLPFNNVTDFGELSDGTMLIASVRGLYKLKVH